MADPLDAERPGASRPQKVSPRNRFILFQPTSGLGEQRGLGRTYTRMSRRIVAVPAQERDRPQKPNRAERKEREPPAYARVKAHDEDGRHRRAPARSGGLDAFGHASLIGRDPAAEHLRQRWEAARFPGPEHQPD